LEEKDKGATVSEFLGTPIKEQRPGQCGARCRTHSDCTAQCSEMCFFI